MQGLLKTPEMPVVTEPIDSCPYCITGNTFRRVKREKVANYVPSHMLSEIGENEPVVQCTSCKGVYCCNAARNVPLQEGEIPLAP